MRFQELAGGYRLLIILLALPVLQQRLQHVQTVVDSTGAQQRSSGGTGDEGGRLQRRGDGDQRTRELPWCRGSSEPQTAVADSLDK